MDYIKMLLTSPHPAILLKKNKTGLKTMFIFTEIVILKMIFKQCEVELYCPQYI